MLKVVILLMVFVSLCDTLCEQKTRYTDCSSVHDVRKLKQRQNWKKIQINSTEKQRINGLTFKKTPKVEEISFWNAVSDLEEFTFYELSSLKELHFEDCDLPKIKKHWFSDLTSISTIIIDKSNVKSLEPGCFEGSTNLTTLGIIGNNISTIVANVFSGTSIVELMFISNQVQFIQDNAFMNMSRLENLFLNGNLLKSFIPKEILPRNLQQLYLSSNQIETIPSGAFHELSNLKQLGLSCNKLESFPESALPYTGLPFLTHLYLRNNRLNYLPRSFIRYFPKLEKMDILGNPWQCGCYKEIMKSILLHNVSIRYIDEYLDGRRPVCVVPQTGSDKCLNNIQIENNLNDYFMQQIVPCDLYV